MLIGLVAEEEGEERESHSKVGTLLGPTKISFRNECVAENFDKLVFFLFSFFPLFFPRHIGEKKGKNSFYWT